MSERKMELKDLDVQPVELAREQTEGLEGGIGGSYGSKQDNDWSGGRAEYWYWRLFLS
jgi:hypothetical protein